MRYLFVVLSFVSVDCIAQLIHHEDISDLLINNQYMLGVHLDDFNEYEISDHYISSISGIEHIYILQRHQDIPVLNGILNLNIFEDKIISFGDRTIKNINLKQLDFSTLISPEDGLKSALKSLNLPTKAIPQQEETFFNNSQQINQIIYRKGNLSKRSIPVKLYWLKDGEKESKPIWVVEIEMLEGSDYWHICIDGYSGKFISKAPLTITCNFDPWNASSKHHYHNHDASIPKTTRGKNLMVDTTYNVYDLYTESPNHGNRSIVSNPWNRAGTGNEAGTLGWHFDGDSIYNITRGNNVYTYEDQNNVGSGISATSSSFEFDFPLDFALPPDQNMEASLTNLFFWNNSVHDIFYQYGFTEVSGNYQNDNLGRGGLGGDFINSEGLDGGSTSNANFTITPDGVSGRMQMYLWSTQEIPPHGEITPDGSFDNGIIVHEYGHGISTRLTGGPSSHLCLIHNESMGEGWSDFFALMLTTDWSMANEDDIRGIGTYVLGEDSAGTGIRTFPYTTDMNINPMTYDYLKTSFGSVHYVGSVWATMLWEMTWEIIDETAVDTDIYHGLGGNNIALQLVMEGLKMQPCYPGFVDARNAILEADRILYNSKYNCRIWKAFAKRGLGVNASQGFNYFYSDGDENFEVPNGILINQMASEDTLIASNVATLSYQITCLCEDNLGADIKIIPSERFSTITSTTGTITNDTVSINQIDLLCGDTLEVFIEVEIDCFEPYGVDTIVIDDVESSSSLNSILLNGEEANWETTNTLFNSSNTSWFAEDIDSINVSTLQFKDSFLVSDKVYLSFYHKYETEFFWDAGFVQYNIFGDSVWHDAEDMFIENGYPLGLGFTGNSEVYSGVGIIRSTIDFSSLIGSRINIRFLMNCDLSVGGTGINGWYIDDIILSSEPGLASRSIVSTLDTSYTFYHKNFTPIIESEIIHVDTAVGNGGNGSSWTQAFSELRDALAFSGCGDTIYLAEGLYYPTDDLNRDSSFNIVSGINLLGGFPKGGSILEDRDPTVYKSILSGNIGDQTDHNDNSYRLINVDSTVNLVLLNGISITASNANGTGENGIGSALYNQGRITFQEVEIFDVQGSLPGYIIMNSGKHAKLILDEVNIKFDVLPATEAIINRNKSELIIRNRVEVNKKNIF